MSPIGVLSDLRENVTRRFQRLWQRVDASVAKVVRTLVSIVKWWLVGCFLLCVVSVASAVWAFLTYQVLVWALLPTPGLQRPVYFDFSSPPPTARVSLTNRQWHSPGLSKDQTQYLYPHTHTYLSTAHPYNVKLTLELPENPVNYDAGMIMASVALISCSNTTLAESTRPLALPYRGSILTNLAYEILFLLPLSLGIMSRSTVVEVELMEHFYEYHAEPACDAVLQLRTHAWREVHVYTAKMEMGVQLSGIRYYLANWPFSSFTVAYGALYTASFAFLSTLCILVLFVFYSGDNGNQPATESPRAAPVVLRVPSPAHPIPPPSPPALSHPSPPRVAISRVRSSSCPTTPVLHAEHSSFSPRGPLGSGVAEGPAPSIPRHEGNDNDNDDIEEKSHFDDGSGVGLHMLQEDSSTEARSDALLRSRQTRDRDT